MEHQDSGEVLTRERSRGTAFQENSKEKSCEELPLSAGKNGGFTAYNAEFDRRRSDLRKRMVRDRAAAETELARLTKRCDILKEFLFEADSAAENLEDLSSIIHAEKEFASRLEQLEIRYYRYYGRFSDRAGDPGVSGETQEFVSNTLPRSPLQESFLLVGGMLLAAIIIAVTIAAVFL